MPGQDNKWYMRLGGAINLAVYGSSPGERANAQRAVTRLITKLTPAEQQVILQALPGVNFHKPRVHKATGTKRAIIVELLKQGLDPKTVALRTNSRVQYVYNIRREENLNVDRTSKG